ncbi:MAG: DUF4330 domain-containing protein, partial [Oscillospiraceae bacterium]|nr:DUF4330 domain-containing protein [Oscillospiraceae bacterium]
MNANKEKKPGFKFNIIDLIIILFVAAALVGIAMRYNLADKINLNANGETFEIEFITGWNIQEASQQYFEPGVSFYINIDSIKIGEIKEILDIRNPAFDEVVDLRGNIVKTEVPGRIDVIGVMKSTGRTTKEGNVMINGNQFVAPNKEFLVHTGYIEGWIRIISIKKAGD